MTDDPELARSLADGRDHYPVPFLQNLIDNGEGWQSESELGQAIVKALEDGTCVLGPVSHRDYPGGVVPARRDVAAAGTVSEAKLRALTRPARPFPEYSPGECYPPRDSATRPGRILRHDPCRNTPVGSVPARCPV